MTSVVGIVPLYNHALTVPEVLAGLQAHGLYALVVDDGSTDGGADVAEQWLIANGAPGQVIRLAHNQGKAAALLAGWEGGNIQFRPVEVHSNIHSLGP